MKKSTKLAPNVQLKQARVRKGWSQEHVGQEVGTDAFTVSRWERGITMPSPHFRQKLCDLFELTPVELGLVPPETNEAANTANTTNTAPTPAKEVTPTPEPILDPTIPPPPAGEHGLVGREELL